MLLLRLPDKEHPTILYRAECNNKQWDKYTNEEKGNGRVIVLILCIYIMMGSVIKFASYFSIYFCILYFSIL